MVVLFGKKGLLVLAATACTLRSGVALAEPFHEDPPRAGAVADTPHEHWYGWQTLSVDALPAGLFVGAIVADGERGSTFLITGSSTFALGAPLVHVLHERPLIGLASFGLRVGLPLLGLAIGLPFADLSPSPAMPDMADEDASIGATPIIVGGLLGAATASALDAGFLAYDTPPRRSATSETSSALPLGVSLGLARGTSRITLLGEF